MMQFQIKELDYLGRGVARHQSKVYFIENALPNERVNAEVVENKARYSLASTTDIIEASPDRVNPNCQYYAQCGGCNLQHLNYESQLQFKVGIWSSQIQSKSPTPTNQAVNISASPPWSYRTRARLAVQYDRQTIHIGYLQRATHQLLDIAECPILDEDLNDLLADLKPLLQALLPLKVKGLSLHRGAQLSAVNLIGVNKSEKLTQKQMAVIQAKNYQIWFNNELMHQKTQILDYKIPIERRLAYRPNDFVQSNQTMNYKMISYLLNLLEREKISEIVEFFSGLGNFTLAMAQQGVNVLAYEGVANMVESLNQSARQMDMDTRVTAKRADLFKAIPSPLFNAGIAAWLLDPPRSGAYLLCQSVPREVKQIIYISCNQATLSRDASVLMTQGFELVEVQLMDMFPQTTHIESLNYFQRK